jgi:hypothetical protein
MIDRRVRIIESGGKPVPDNARRLSAFSDTPNLVLLGDPGAGKTYAFREAAAAVGGEYLTTRSFLNIPANKLGSILFIDALDEQRTGSSDNSAVDQVVQKLFSCDAQRVRISCRSQDWLGDTDLAVFNDYFDRSGGATVLALEPIDEAEQIAVLQANNASEAEARQFLSDAVERGLAAFTRNPRKMVMLHRVVREGAWPTSLNDLFDRATKLQLTEENATHARAVGGHFTADELRPTAGGVCAARLISDIEGLSLSAPAANDTAPHYRALQHLDLERVLAVLKRPLFVAIGPERVDYDHRTSAEYLAAAWIADAVRDGLPVGRVVAIVGADGHPAPELRGLHAWLPTFLPEHAERFIHADPLGVLEYGDPASLSPSLRRVLLEAIGKLAADNPWFLSFQRDPGGLAALVQDDNVEALCAILRDPNAPRDLRTIAIDAFEAAAPKEAAFETLHHVFANGAAEWSDRSSALKALLAFGDRGAKAVIGALPELSGDADDVLRLRGEATHRLYGNGLGADDVVALMDDLLSTELESSIGLLWDLADSLPIDDIPQILDRFLCAVPLRVTEDYRRSAWDASSFVNRLVARVGNQKPASITAANVLGWMELRQRLKRLGADDRDQDFMAALGAGTGRIEAAFNLFIDRFEGDEDEKPGRSYRRFGELIGPLAKADDICDWCLARLAREADAARRAFVFELALQYGRSDTAERSISHFEALYALGMSDLALERVLQGYLQCDLDWWYKDRQEERRERRAERARRRQSGRDKNRALFATNAERVRAGEHMGLLGFAGEIYFNQYADLDHEAEPRERLAAYLGLENTANVMQGLDALVDARQPPTVDEVLEFFGRKKIFLWWLALVAGVDARLRAGGDLSTLRPEVVETVIIIDLFQMLSRRTKRGKEAEPSLLEVLRDLYPDIAAKAYLRAIESDLAVGSQHPTGLYPFLEQEVFRSARTGALLTLLDEHPLADQRALFQLLEASLAESSLHEQLLRRAWQALKNDKLGVDRLRLWRTAAFVLAPNEMRAELSAALSADRNDIWVLRDFLGYERSGSTGAWPLAASELQYLIATIGALWPPSNHPSNGWSGDTNPWDAAEFVRNLINRLSAMTTAAATDAMRALVEDPTIASYRQHLQYALAQHRSARREAEFDRPNWARTLTALTNKAPANAADLHALVIDHLADLGREIDGSNADLFKQFWNETSHGATDTPKPEESCRDVLIALLRPRLLPLGLTVQPEGKMSAKKRVDIAVAAAGLKLVIEVKLAHSPDLWKAISSQLDYLYTRDPETQGYGVLLVLWFGAKSAKGVTARSKKKAVPESADALESELSSTLKPGQSDRIRANVIDVSGER